MRTLHIVSHTHWDREWYRTFQQFRLRLVQLIDNLLDLLERDKNFKFFMLDGQTIVLDDYLAIRSENEKILRDHIRKGRILTGPWHILPDMFLVGPEAHIRNLLEGDRTARKFGSKMMIGYMPDSFGHFAQMPQLIRGFGMDVISVWRGLDDQPAEFWWEAPDGSRVLMAYLRDSYSNGASLQPSIPSEFAAQLERAADSLAAHSEVSHYLIMFGNDHMEPPRDTSKAIAYANAALRGTKVIHSTLPNYIKAIEKQITREEIHLPIYKGELRSSKNSHLLPGVLSTRMWIKQRNHACETLLEKWAEPFSTLAGLQGKKLEGLQVKKLEGSQVKKLEGLQVKKLEGSQVKKLEGLQAKKLEGSQVGTFKPANIQTFQLIKDPAQILHNAWRLLMECHPHDSICGCSIDQVHEEMKSRFDQVEQIGEEITRQSLETLAGMINTSHWGSVSGDQSAIVVFNPSSAPRTDLVSMELSLPDGVQNFDLLDENGTIVLHQSASGNSSEWINVNIQREELGGILAMVHEGRAGNLVIQDINFKRANNIVHVEAIMSENGSPNLKAWEEGTKALQGYIEDSSVELFHIRAHSRQSTHILFAASDVPAFGWKTFRVRGKESAPESVHITPLMRALAPLAASPFAQKILARFTQSKSRPPYRIENEFFMVEAASDATLIITDKRDGQIYRGLNRFVDGGDCGDEYNFCPPLSDLQAGARLKSVRTAKGAVLQTLELDLDLRVPSELAPDRKSRSLDFISVPITTHITLAAGIARVDVQTKVDNRAKDHRLRVHFPAPFKVDAADYDSHFEIINRKIGLPPFDETWIEQPRPEVPQRAFADVSDGQHGLMIANRGLPEVEVLKNKDGNSEIALTLLRCVGWLSRDDFPARKGHAGPFLATPAAQMQGAWTFDYSIIPHSGNWKEAFQLAYAFETPLRGVSAALHDGALPASGSFVEITPSTFVVSAIKESEDRSGWIVRGINLTDEKINASIRPWRQFKKVERVNLAEQKIESLKPAPEGTVTVEARGKEIVTVMFSD